jgi:oligopeptide/dipeptide ABC transporter ATP-binding protein
LASKALKKTAQQALLEVNALSVALGSREDSTTILREVSFQLERGRTLGVVGESGCGKSMTALSLMGLLPPEAQLSGSVIFDGLDLASLSDRQWQTVRGPRIAMIFQEPMTALNPVMSIGRQLAEMLIVHEGASSFSARAQSIAMLDRVGIADPQTRVDAYPHQLSGGMRQRVMIAMALACKPDLLIADEPTTALDVSIEAQILDLLLDLQQQEGMALLLISHNLAVISEMADDIMVMYAGEVVESGSLQQVLQQPLHPYTQGLIASIPSMTDTRTLLPTIPGTVPNLKFRPIGCTFAPRCAYAQDLCKINEIALREIAAQHRVACVLP